MDKKLVIPFCLVNHFKIKMFSLKIQFLLQLKKRKKKKKNKKKKNKKHSENADTSTSVTFDLELTLRVHITFGFHGSIFFIFGTIKQSSYVRTKMPSNLRNSI